MKKYRKRQYLGRMDPEMLYWIRLSGPKKTHERPTKAVFLRLNSRRGYFTAVHLTAAGYPMAVPKDLATHWTEIHKWCKEQFRDSRGRTYTWTGEKFLFQTKADCEKFVARWC